MSGDLGWCAGMNQGLPWKSWVLSYNLNPPKELIHCSQCFSSLPTPTTSKQIQNASHLSQSIYCECFKGIIYKYPRHPSLPTLQQYGKLLGAEPVLDSCLFNSSESSSRRRYHSVSSEIKCKWDSSQNSHLLLAIQLYRTICISPKLLTPKSFVTCHSI